MNPKNPAILVERVIAFAKIVYPKHNLENHILPAVRIGADFARQLSADRLIVETALYLHDTGRILFFYKYHEQVGYYLTKALLPLLGYTKEQVHAIACCVKVHSGKGIHPFDTIEAEIVANADAVAQFENFLYMFSIHFATHGRDLEKTKGWLSRKYERSWQTKLTLAVSRDRVMQVYPGIKQALEL